MLARAVYARKGFLVEEHHEAMTSSDGGHNVHHQLVLVVGEVGFAIDGCELKLVGSHLVVARLEGDAEAVGADFNVAHERCHTRGDGTEVVVVELLILR